MERISIGSGVILVLVATLACKGKASDDGASGASSTTAATAVAATVASSAEPETTASAAPSASAAPRPTVSAKPKCSGLMIEHRCARQCASDDDCPDPKERCNPYTGADDDGQQVMNAPVCVYDADNEPRAPKAAVVGPTVGVKNAKNGDCPKGWAASVSSVDECDKECTTDAQCGPGNKCRAVGPIGSGKQCQKG